MIVEGRFTRQVNQCSYVARIGIAIEESTLPTEIIIEPAAVPNYNSSQALPNKNVKEAYWDWKQGALIGINYALSKAGANQKFSIRISSIIGSNVDTNATIVAAAAIDGVWKALNHQPSAIEWQAIEKVVLASWQKAPFNLPTEFEID
jgi:hypothetical protein